MLRAIIPIAIVLVVGIWVVYAITRESTSDSKKSLARRLDSANALINTLQFEAAEHVALGDGFAAVVLDEIRQHQNKERELR